MSRIGINSRDAGVVSASTLALFFVGCSLTIADLYSGHADLSQEVIQDGGRNVIRDPPDEGPDIGPRASISSQWKSP